MKNKLLLFILLFSFTNSFATPAQRPSIRFHIVNKTDKPIHRLILIHSDTIEFNYNDNDTAAELWDVNEINLHLIYEGGWNGSSQKLILYVGDTIYESNNFHPAKVYGWAGFEVRITNNKLIVEETNYLKILKTLSDLLIFIPIIILLKYIFSFLILFRYPIKFRIEFLPIFLAFSLAIYLPPLLVQLRPIYHTIIALLSLLTILEVIIYKWKYRQMRYLYLTTTLIISNIVIAFIGILITLILIGLFGCMFI